MTSIIHKYLSEYYYLRKTKIRKKDTEVTSHGYVTYISITDERKDLIEELSQVFGLTKKQLKYYIKGWVRKQNRGFAFEEYWNPTPKAKYLNGLLLPMAQRVAAQTLSYDLVAVQPMEPPRLGLDWSHFIGNFGHDERRLERYANQPINQNFYGNVLIEPPALQTPPSSPENRAAQRMLIERWIDNFNRV